MKKRIERIGLSVILVLALASFANATLSWTVVDQDAGNIELGDIVLITVSSDATGDWDYGIYVTTPTAAVLQNPTKLQGAGNAYSATSYGGYVGHDYHSGGGGQKAAGWSTVQFLSNTADTYTVNLYDYTTYGGDYVNPGTAALSVSLDVVPEPATIALLGLGGMFLLRRRRRG